MSPHHLFGGGAGGLISLGGRHEEGIWDTTKKDGKAFNVGIRIRTRERSLGRRANKKTGGRNKSTKRPEKEVYEEMKMLRPVADAQRERIVLDHTSHRQESRWIRKRTSARSLLPKYSQSPTKERAEENGGKKKESERFKWTIVVKRR